MWSEKSSRRSTTRRCPQVGFYTPLKESPEGSRKPGSLKKAIKARFRDHRSSRRSYGATGRDTQDTDNIVSRRYLSNDDLTVDDAGQRSSFSFVSSEEQDSPLTSYRALENCTENSVGQVSINSTDSVNAAAKESFPGIVDSLVLTRDKVHSFYKSASCMQELLDREDQKTQSELSLCYITDNLTGSREIRADCNGSVFDRIPGGQKKRRLFKKMTNLGSTTRKKLQRSWKQSFELNSKRYNTLGNNDSVSSLEFNLEDVAHSTSIQESSGSSQCTAQHVEESFNKRDSQIIPSIRENTAKKIETISSRCTNDASESESMDEHSVEKRDAYESLKDPLHISREIRVDTPFLMRTKRFWNVKKRLFKKKISTVKRRQSLALSSFVIRRTGSQIKLEISLHRSEDGNGVENCIFSSRNRRKPGSLPKKISLGSPVTCGGRITEVVQTPMLPKRSQSRRLLF